MTDSHSHLHGSCACERNQYTVIIPSSNASLAQVFFDNSASNRRSQATPVTAWLRVPLSWYHSTTYAQFPDETHGSIKRTFYTPSTTSTLPPTRRQFCGYCGTHLTAWNEGESQRSGDFVDVTLGSLLNDSLDALEALQLYVDLEDSEEDAEVGAPMSSNQEAGPTTHSHDLVMTSPGDASEQVTPSAVQKRPIVAHKMLGRGVPYFEEMVENSRLGRIKRQKGGHTNADGTSVQWEIVEINDGGSTSAGENGNKRLKLDA